MKAPALMFPRPLGQSAYNERIKAAAPLMKAALRWLADHTPGSAELLGKSTARPQRPRACDNGVMRCPAIADRNEGPE